MAEANAAQNEPSGSKAPNLWEPPNSPSQKGQGLSREEQIVLAECANEAKMQRAWPVGIVSGLAVYGLVKWGKLAANPTWGPFPKVFAAAIVGFQIGRLSYYNACMDKVLEKIPDSFLAETVRARRGIPLKHPERMEERVMEMQQQKRTPQQYQQQPFRLPPPTETQSQEGEGSAVTYDGLRQQHRGHENQHHPVKTFGSFSGGQPPQPSLAPAPEDDPSFAPPSKLKKRVLNKYGDEGFE